MSFSTMYIGATGMKAMGTGMDVLGHNIANVNTVGFKNAQAFYADLLSQDQVQYGDSGNSYSQVGMGVGVSMVRSDFSQGAFETTNTVTDLAIGGQGFFRVTNPADSSTVYTRAGNFRFNNEGYLVDPTGYRLQGAGGDVKLDLDADSGTVLMPGQATSSFSLATNLAAASDASTDPDDPFFAMFKEYDGAASPPLAGSAYGYSSGIKLYDSLGNSHDVTVAYDKVTVSGAMGRSFWEYVVYFDPADDARTGLAGTSGAGLVMAGTLTFNSFGLLESQSAFTYGGAGDARSLSNWTPASFSDGFPSFTMSFASSAGNIMGFGAGLSGASAWTGSVASAADVGASISSLPASNGSRQTVSSTAYVGGGAETLQQTQNGYAQGYLVTMNFEKNGTLVGSFSNGQNDDLADLKLYTFTNPYGLKRLGSNHFAATAEAGTATESTPGTGGTGTIVQNSLEQSNVDLSREFVGMIGTQRGFQANSKTITTADQLLQIALGMKR